MKNNILAVVIALVISSANVVTTADDEIISNDTYLTQEVIELCQVYGNKYNICPELIMAIIERESEGNTNCYYGGCKGLMQVYEKYHKDRMARLDAKDLYNPEDNILTATDYLSELFDKYEDVGLVLDIYNGSSKALERAKRGELSQYSSWVLTRSSELEKLHNKV